MDYCLWVWATVDDWWGGKRNDENQADRLIPETNQWLMRAYGAAQTHNCLHPLIAPGKCPLWADISESTGRSVRSSGNWLGQLKLNSESSLWQTLRTGADKHRELLKNAHILTHTTPQQHQSVNIPQLWALLSAKLGNTVRKRRVSDGFKALLLCKVVRQLLTFVLCLNY